MNIALTIAGSDSSAGAGIQADLKTFQQFGVYGTCVVTAITAQNTLGVSAVEPVSPAMLRAQLEALATDLPPVAVKSGMLATAEVLTQVALALRTYEWSVYVLDPVLRSSSGRRLLTEEGERLLLRSLVPLAALVTPNLEEAHALTGLRVDDVASMTTAGGALLDLGAGAVLIKGGHLPGNDLVDVLVTRSGTHEYRHPRISTRATHGTGCTLSAAITAGLALRTPPSVAGSTKAPKRDQKALIGAVGDAVDFVQRAMATAPNLGAGQGPLDHTASLKAGPRSPQ